MVRFICGKNSVVDAIENKVPIKQIFLTNKNSIFIPQNIKILYVTKEYLNKLVSQNHQGYVAEIESIPFYDIEVIYKDKPNKVLVLDHLQDPHNFGAIIRSANAAGVFYIIFPKERAVDVNETVLKVSSGGFVNMKFIKVGSLSATITKLKKNNFWIYSTNLGSDSIPLDQVQFNYPMALILGTEKSGVSTTLLKLSDQNIYIPTNGTVQSLNVSVAAGIILFKI